jgi:hypothetical protein
MLLHVAGTHPSLVLQSSKLPPYFHLLASLVHSLPLSCPFPLLACPYSSLASVFQHNFASWLPVLSEWTPPLPLATMELDQN